jgi:hypothetical protein
LKTTHQTEPDNSCLANFCFLSKGDNNLLGGRAPSEYRKEMPDAVDEILEHAICPPSLFADSYAVFISERAEMLAIEAKKLLG